MKKVIFVLVVALSVTTASAQIKLGANASLQVPTGNLGNMVDMGFGGGISGEYLVTPNIGVGLNIGYYALGEKDNMGMKCDFIPAALNAKYYFIPEGSIKVYAGLDLGLYTLKTKMNGNDLGLGDFDDILGDFFDNIDINIPASNSTKSNFGLAPVVGLQFGLTEKLALDVNAKYNFIFTEGDATDIIGFNVGLVYTLK